MSALEVVHLSAYAFGGLVAAPPMGDAIEEMLGHAEARMRALTGVEGRAGYGLPGEDLAAFSDEVDLLIVGSRSYGPVRRLVYGAEFAANWKVTDYWKVGASYTWLKTHTNLDPGSNSTDSRADRCMRWIGWPS